MNFFQIFCLSNQKKSYPSSVLYSFLLLVYICYTLYLHDRMSKSIFSSIQQRFSPWWEKKEKKSHGFFATLREAKKEREKKAKSTSVQLKKEVEHLKELEKQEAEKTQLSNLSARSIVLFWVTWLATVYAGYLLFQSLGFVYLILAALIISISMEVVIHTISKRCNRWWSIVASYILLVVFMFSWLLLLIPFVAQYISLFIDMTVSYITSVIEILETSGFYWFVQSTSLPEWVKTWVIDYTSQEGLAEKIQNAIRENLSQIVNFSKTIGEQSANFLVTIISGFFTSFSKSIFNFTIVMVLAVFFSVEKASLVKFLASISGAKHQHYWELKLQTLYKKLGQWLQSQLIVSAFVGSLVYCMLRLVSPWINLDGKLSLALIAALTTIIPYIGPILWAVPAIIATLITHSIPWAIIILALYVVIQQIEWNFFTPFFMKKQLGVSPALIMVVVLLGGTTLGFVGIALSVPLAVIITLLAKDDYN